jgi:hypothetical protein
LVNRFLGANTEEIITDYSSLIIDQLDRETKWPNEVVLFYYFDYTDKANQKPDNFAASILKQMLCAANNIPANVEFLYNECTKRSTRPDFEVLSRVVHTMMTQFSTIFLVIDALDECQFGLDKLEAFLHQLQDTCGLRVKIMCTTRSHLNYFVSH